MKNSKIRAMKRVLGICLPLGLAALLLSCDVDLFHRSLRSIQGAYSMYIADDQESFYIMPASGNGGSISGKLTAIGWNSNLIVFEEANHPGDLRVINIHQQEVSQPINLNSSSLESDVRAVKLISPQEAWKLLH